MHLKFFDYVFSNNIPQAERLLQSGVVHINVLNPQGETVLAHAVRRNRPHVIDWALKKGADPSVGDTLPIDWAAGDGNAELIEKLLFVGSPINNAVMKAWENGHKALSINLYKKYPHSIESYLQINSRNMIEVILTSAGLHGIVRRKDILKVLNGYKPNLIDKMTKRSVYFTKLSRAVVGLNNIEESILRQGLRNEFFHKYNTGVDKRNELID
ncbi:Ankyrin repeats (3 copies) [compost metagenome]